LDAEFSRKLGKKYLVKMIEPTIIKIEQLSQTSYDKELLVEEAKLFIQRISENIVKCPL
jgi:hypothetical protein